MITIPFYDYQCQNGHVMPMQLRKYEEKTIVCDKCGLPSNRLYNFRFNAHGLPNGFNSMPRDVTKDKVKNGTPKRRR